MNKLKFIEEIYIDDYECFDYKSILFDGCNFYIVIYGNQSIVKYNYNFKKEECFEICREYIDICYDNEEKCFWAVAYKNGYRIFKLDMCFKEIESTKLILDKCFQDKITGISYSCIDNTLVMSSTNCIGKIYKTCDSVNKIQCFNCFEICDVLSISPGYVLTIRKHRKQKILIYDDYFKLINEFEFPNYYLIINIAFEMCENNKKVRFFILVKNRNYKDNKYEILVYEINLGLHACSCNHKLNNCCFKDDCEDNCKDNAYNKIVQSIALVEASISHILNAEGEKIQKVLSDCNDIDKILCINKEVNKTIINITHLEQVIYEQLVALKECECDECSNNSCCEHKYECECEHECDCCKYHDYNCDEKHHDYNIRRYEDE